MEDAQARRERLKALRQAAEILQQPEKEAAGEKGREAAEPREGEQVAEGEGNGGEAREADGEEEAGEGPPQGAVSFRNYIPRDEDLMKQKLAPAKVPELQAPTPADAALLESEDPITSIAPRKENWDLRRDVEKRLQKLERRTQRAMIQLMRDEEERRTREEMAEEGGDGDEAREEGG